MNRNMVNLFTDVSTSFMFAAALSDFQNSIDHTGGLRGRIGRSHGSRRFWWSERSEVSCR